MKDKLTTNSSDKAVKLPMNIKVGKPNINWDELRKNFFNECTTETPQQESGKKVNMAPHDLFEWFKKEISEYVG